MSKNTLLKYVKKKEEELEVVSKKRVYGKPNNRHKTGRDAADRDYARLLYSSSFRRLQGKMQLLVPIEDRFYRNRLTHSIEVSQIAQSMAKLFGMTDIITVRTCALAHDLGNPPFGHAGEITLSNINKDFPYEGNAQTLRILTELEKRHPEHNGLDLTIRTLLGVVKYPFSQKENCNKFLYHDDYKMIKKWAKENNISLKTIDCEIMDLADEIAYAAHDLEDSLKMNYFTIDDILFEFKQSAYSDCYDKFLELVDDAKEHAGKSKEKSSEIYSMLFHKELTALIVNTLVADIDVINKDGKKSLGYKSYHNLAYGLKKLTFNAVKRRPDVIQYEKIGDIVIKGLFKVFSDESYNKNLELLPAEYRDHSNKHRTILDYIGGMMDSFAISQYKLYYGNNSLECIYTNS